MKTLFFTISLLFTSLLFSQQIKLEDNKFYLNDNQLYNHEVKQLLASNPEALKLYTSARTKESVGGFLLGFGLGLTFSDLVVGLTSDVQYPTAITYVGLGFAVVSIPVLSGRKKMIQESIDIYNQGIQGQKQASNTNYEVNIVNNSKGIGIQITF